MSTPGTSAKEIFSQALELSTVTERQAYLDTQCGSNADLRREVEELLRHQADVGSFLDSPPTAVLESADQLRTFTHETPSLEFLAPSSRADSLGRLGHYEILEVVGSGGMGIVLKAFDERLQRVVAIKAMAQSLAASGTGRQRFVREAQAAAAVNHDNVVDIYAVEEAGPVPYFVMEYVAGVSLEDKLVQQGPLALKEILRIGLQTADGLAAAHRQGLVHRDVKPANILLENGVGRVKITDFGLARAADDASLTHSGVIVGTPAYMSPEQARGEAVDHRSDLFSLGSVLYALSAGQSPFQGSTSLGVLKRVCEETPHAIRDLNSDIPEWLCAVIDKLHAKLPAERYQSAAEVADVLGSCLAHLQQPSIPLPSLPVGNALHGVPQVKPGGAKGTSGKSRNPTEGVPYKPGHRWRIAAFTSLALLVALVLTLSLSEAGGIGNLAAFVVRIFTPDGILVVETDDPDVKVTIEGDGGLVITGAGPQEVRLQPGSYRLRADKDGKPARPDRELVSISRGGKQVVRVRLEAESPKVVQATANTLTEEEQAAGWKLLFDGKSTAGWRTYKKTEVGPGWKVEEGTLTRGTLSPWVGGAGHLITADKFGAFELSLEYKIATGGNSGVMFHATEESDKPWEDGLEIQILDNQDGRVGQKSGWLFELYWPEGELDATRPAGEWNELRLLITPEKCATWMNGKLYYEFVKGSKDWDERVAKRRATTSAGTWPGTTKRHALPPNFGKATSGHIALQDHGDPVSFRNIKIREIRQTEPKPFVVLGAQGPAERNFDTLAEALQGSSDGDTIEIRGNGPFASRPVKVRHALTIRAAAGFRPVIRLSPPDADSRANLLEVHSPLVLEGLELWGSRATDAWTVLVLVDSGAPLYIANCRLQLDGSGRCMALNSRLCRLNNCELLGVPAYNIQLKCQEQSSLTIDNCLFVSNQIISIHDSGRANVQVARSSCAARHGFEFALHKPLSPTETKSAPVAVTLDVSRTVLHAPRSFLHFNHDVAVEDADDVLRRLFRWRGENSAYHHAEGFLFDSVNWKDAASRIKNLDEWREYWDSPETECVQGTIKFEGGDLHAKSTGGAGNVTRDDFRLRPDSAGYRAGPDGKDLGADIDLVGPGPAYERWKKTPAYQAWLKDTKQSAPAAPIAEPQAFVVMGGQEVAERKFDTLAEAVQGSSDGDTVEVRGNGPFLSDKVIINHALVIRAAAGFRPVIRLSPQGEEARANLITSRAPLVLEGLELWRVGGSKGPSNQPLIVDCTFGAPIHIASCRLVWNGSYYCIKSHSALCQLVNCELLANGAVLNATPKNQGRLVLDNCLLAGVGLSLRCYKAGVAGVDVRVVGSTHAGPRLFDVARSTLSILSERDQVRPALTIHSSRNVSFAAHVLQFEQSTGQSQTRALPLDEAGPVLRHFLQWRGEHNVYPLSNGLLLHSVDWSEKKPGTLTNLEEWRKFWDSPETECIQGSVKFQGGDLLARAASAPETLTPEDFRLRSDSAGYRAGPDGKDLGADIDLVGPGLAYERWKKTPEYEQWLKESGQKK